jgi:hypothetical protein
MGDHASLPPRMTVEDLLAAHAIDPAGLESAPVDCSRRQVEARICSMPPRPCTFCGEVSPSARAVDLPGHGPRWVDLCSRHWRQVRRRWRGPSTVEGIVADLRAAADAVGVKLTILIDE